MSLFEDHGPVKVGRLDAELKRSLRSHVAEYDELAQYLEPLLLFISREERDLFVRLVCESRLEVAGFAQEQQDSALLLVTYKGVEHRLCANPADDPLLNELHMENVEHELEVNEPALDFLRRSQAALRDSLDVGERLMFKLHCAAGEGAWAEFHEVPFPVGLHLGLLRLEAGGEIREASHEPRNVLDEMAFVELRKRKPDPGTSN